MSIIFITYVTIASHIIKRILINELSVKLLFLEVNLLFKFIPQPQFIYVYKQVTMHH